MWGTSRAKATPLLKFLGKEHYGVSPPGDDFRRFARWLDANSEFFGCYEDTAAQCRGEVVMPGLHGGAAFLSRMPALNLTPTLSTTSLCRRGLCRRGRPGPKALPVLLIGLEDIEGLPADVEGGRKDPEALHLPDVLPIRPE